MTRTIVVASGKGGVGKTTVVANLSHVLTELGKDVTAIDTNITTPHLGLHLGFHSAPKSLNDFLRGKAQIRDITYYHPSGFKVIPAGLSINDLIGIDSNKMQSLTLGLLGKTDIILLDSAPSLGREATLSLKLGDEVLLLTNPNTPAVIDAIKVAKVAESLNKKILGVVVNRAHKRSELNAVDIEEIVGYPVITQIPEDPTIQMALASRTSVTEYSPKSKASIEFQRLGHHLIGKQFNYKLGFFEKLLRAFD